MLEEMHVHQHHHWPYCPYYHHYHSCNDNEMIDLF